MSADIDRKTRRFGKAGESDPRKRAKRARHTSFRELVPSALLETSEEIRKRIKMNGDSNRSILGG